MADTLIRWQLRSRAINEVVVARDQWEAWDTLRHREAAAFGLAVVAEPDERGYAESIPVQTETLMRRWGRHAEADLFHQASVDAGLVSP